MHPDTVSQMVDDLGKVDIQELHRQAVYVSPVVMHRHRGDIFECKSCSIAALMTILEIVDKLKFETSTMFYNQSETNKGTETF